MKIYSYYYFIACCIVVYSCGSNHDNHQHEHHEEHLHAEDNAHSDLIILDTSDAKMLGIEVDNVILKPFEGVVRVSGQLEYSPTDIYMATAKSAGIVRLSAGLSIGGTVSAGSQIASISAKGISGGDSNELAYADLLAAKTEFERLKPLHEEGIVSTKDFREAESKYNSVLVAYSGSRTGSSVVSDCSGVIIEVCVMDGDYVDKGAPIAKVVRDNSLVLRADIPINKLSMIGNIVSGNIRFVGKDDVVSFESLNIKRIAHKSTGMSGAFVPVYFKLDNKMDLVSGMFADIYIINNECHEAISVPLESVSEQQGVNFVYIQLDDDCYKKVPVVLGQNNGKMVEIKAGLNIGDKVVSKGMIFVKLAESNGAVPEGHTHSH